MAEKLTKLDKLALALLSEGPLVPMMNDLWCRPDDIRTEAFLREGRSVGARTVNRLLERGLAVHVGGEIRATEPTTDTPREEEPHGE